MLGPWRLAGWLTGALPALFGARSVHATIAAVESFVDAHYQQQIDHLQRVHAAGIAAGGSSTASGCAGDFSTAGAHTGDPSTADTTPADSRTDFSARTLLALLQTCQADERAHRDEAAALAGAKLPWPMGAWCALVAIGSNVAVILARRV